MLEGWYCRTMANQHAAAEHTENDDDMDGNICESGGSEDERRSSDDEMSAVNQKLIDYKSQYTNLKKKLKFLLYVSNNRVHI